MIHVILFPVPGFQNKEANHGKTQFIGDLLEDTAPKLCLRSGYEPLNLLHFVSILAVKSENSYSEQYLGMGDLLLPSKIQLLCLLALH